MRDWKARRSDNAERTELNARRVTSRALVAVGAQQALVEQSRRPKGGGEVESIELTMMIRRGGRFRIPRSGRPLLTLGLADSFARFGCTRRSWSQTQAGKRMTEAARTLAVGGSEV